MYCFWSFEKISRGCCVIWIFLIFSGLAGLVSVVVCVPKAIPHFVALPYSSEAYVNVLFKAYLNKNVH